MKVLLYSHFFYPSVGGLETVSLALAEGFSRNQIDCKVVTITPVVHDPCFPFEVIRNPKRNQQMQLVKWADVILFNGASLAFQPWVVLFRKPFVWVHVGYQISCIDGAGWVDGRKAPLQPFHSFIFHCRLKGVGHGTRAGVKLLIRRMVAKYLVSKNIAITQWMDQIQPLPRQVHIYNPFPIDKYVNRELAEPEYDFLYLGRIVSEKGVATLLKAFAAVSVQYYRPLRLLIIGDGDWRKKMEQLTHELNIENAVTFVGNKTGEELLNWVSKGSIAVVPSEWYEPMGGVALELMAAGKNLIVSEQGGLKECVGDAGLSFPNGNDSALAQCMCRLLDDAALKAELLEKGKKQIQRFSPALFIDQYIKLLKEISYSN